MCWLTPLAPACEMTWFRPFALVEVMQGTALPAVFGEIALLCTSTYGMEWSLRVA